MAACCRTLSCCGLVGKVRKALDAARRCATIHRDPEANEAWEAVYPELTAERPGMFGAITARAEAHVLRLSVIYALLDGGAIVRLPHLEAALAVWQYAEDSARFIFGDATGDPIADRVPVCLRAGMGQWRRTRLLTSLVGTSPRRVSRQPSKHSSKPARSVSAGRDRRPAADHLGGGAMTLFSFNSFFSYSVAMREGWRAAVCATKETRKAPQKERTTENSVRNKRDKREKSWATAVDHLAGKGTR